MPGMTPPGERHSTNGLAAGYPIVSAAPSAWAYARLPPGTTRVEAYAGDEWLSTKRHTAGAGVDTSAPAAQASAQVRMIAVRGQGRRKRPHPVGHVLACKCVLWDL